MVRYCGAWLAVAGLLCPVVAGAGAVCQPLGMSMEDWRDALPVCPFAPWYHRNTSAPSGYTTDARYCYECRWCPFRAETCCEKQDEVLLLKNIYISGMDAWSCFITIAHFQECGKCSPLSRNFTVYGDASVWPWLRYASDFNGEPDRGCRAIRICKQACGYIYKQCRKVRMLNGSHVIDPDEYPNSDAFCAGAGDNPLYCYSAAPAAKAAALLSACVGLLLVWVMG